MINAIIGDLVSVTASSLILRSGGIEYVMEVSATTASAVSSLTDKTGIRILTVMVVRQDFLGLYGFFDEKERNCFNQLQTVPGIGAKQSLKILSSISVDKLILALDQKDITSLSKIPGIGPKTGQKLILQLRNVLVYEDEEEKSASDNKKTGGEFSELVDSLSEMGFDKKLINKELDKIRGEKSSELKNMTHSQAEALIFPLILRRLS